VRYEAQVLYGDEGAADPMAERFYSLDFFALPKC
jgi:hypothetical protein